MPKNKSVRKYQYKFPSIKILEKSKKYVLFKFSSIRQFGPAGFIKNVCFLFLEKSKPRKKYVVSIKIPPRELYSPAQIRTGD
ncbi:MAG: hypothetical protein BV456_11355 [Thermoplasmata archaeon M8B2D]|nr:MAG: hypothetical protein BV456_11355 [Thermoplasmata archaeon M8B2D]